MNRLKYGYTTFDVLLPGQHKNTLQVYTLEVAYHNSILEGTERDEIIQKTWLDNRPDLSLDHFRFVEISTKSVDECTIYHGNKQVLKLDDVDGYGLSRSAKKHGLSKNSAVYMMLRSIPEFQPLKEHFFNILVNQKEKPIVRQITDAIQKKIQAHTRRERE